jgi:hypothetical protein
MGDSTAPDHGWHRAWLSRPWVAVTAGALASLLCTALAYAAPAYAIRPH